MGSNGKVVQVQCKVCSFIDGKDKLLVAKLDSLWKHVGCRKALVAMSRVKVGEHYFLKSNAHVANEKLYFTKGLEIVLQQVIHGATQFLNKKKNNCAIFLDFSLIQSRLPHDKIHNNAYIIYAAECS
jgi:hypothetical protein